MNSPDVRKAAAPPASAPSGRHPSVSAVTVNWNGLADTVSCVESLLRQTHSLQSIVVVDNASTGTDVDALRSRFADSITLVRNSANVGCGRGYNAGIRYILENNPTDFVLVLNNDIVADPRMVEQLLLVAMREDRAAATGPKTYFYNYEGRDDVIWSAGGRTSYFSPQIHSLIGRAETDTGQYDTVRSLEWVVGSVMLLNTAPLAAGVLFNPRYFAGFEDAELCYELKKRGYQVLYAPQAKAWHRVNASARRLAIHYVNPPARYYFIARCFPWYGVAWQFLLLPVIFTRWAVLFTWRIRNPKAIRRSLSDSIRFVRAVLGVN